MDMIPLHPTQPLGITFDDFPCFLVRSVNDGGVLCGRGDGLHFHLYGLDTVTLISADEFFRSVGGIEGCDGESLFVVCVYDFFDLTQGITTELGICQLRGRVRG